LRIVTKDDPDYADIIREAEEKRQQRSRFRLRPVESDRIADLEVAAKLKQKSRIGKLRPATLPDGSIKEVKSIAPKKIEYRPVLRRDLLPSQIQAQKNFEVAIAEIQKEKIQALAEVRPMRKMRAIAKDLGLSPKWFAVTNGLNIKAKEMYLEADAEVKAALPINSDVDIPISSAYWKIVTQIAKSKEEAIANRNSMPSRKRITQLAGCSPSWFGGRTSGTAEAVKLGNEIYFQAKAEVEEALRNAR